MSLNSWFNKTLSLKGVLEPWTAFSAPKQKTAAVQPIPNDPVAKNTERQAAAQSAAQRGGVQSTILSGSSGNSSYSQSTFGS